MQCSVCGRKYTSKSLGGPGICSSCDCGISPERRKFTVEESALIAQRYKLKKKPYYIKLSSM